MAVSSELMYAILAMDAYNRGYNPGISLSGTNIGTATIGRIRGQVLQNDNPIR